MALRPVVPVRERRRRPLDPERPARPRQRFRQPLRRNVPGRVPVRRHDDLPRHRPDRGRDEPRRPVRPEHAITGRQHARPRERQSLDRSLRQPDLAAGWLTRYEDARPACKRRPAPGVDRRPLALPVERERPAGQVDRFDLRRPRLPVARLRVAEDQHPGGPGRQTRPAADPRVLRRQAPAHRRRQRNARGPGRSTGEVDRARCPVRRHRGRPHQPRQIRPLGRCGRRRCRLLAGRPQSLRSPHSLRRRRLRFRPDAEQPRVLLQDRAVPEAALAIGRALPAAETLIGRRDPRRIVPAVGEGTRPMKLPARSRPSVRRQRQARPVHHRDRRALVSPYRSRSASIAARRMRVAICDMLASSAIARARSQSRTSGRVVM